MKKTLTALLAGVALSASLAVAGFAQDKPTMGVVKSGAISGGFMWNPAEAGRVFVTMGKMLMDGTAITDGTDIPGLGMATPDAANKDIITSNLIAINADTADGLADLGL